MISFPMSSTTAMLCVRMIRADNDRRHLTFSLVVRNQVQLPNIIVHTAAGSSRGKCKQWQRALGILEVRHRETTYVKAWRCYQRMCEERAMATAGHRPAQRHDHDLQCCCQRSSGRRTMATCYDSVLPDGANYRAAMTACVKRQQ